MLFPRLKRRVLFHELEWRLCDTAASANQVPSICASARGRFAKAQPPDIECKSCQTSQKNQDMEYDEWLNDIEPYRTMMRAADVVSWFEVLTPAWFGTSLKTIDAIDQVSRW